MADEITMKLKLTPEGHAVVQDGKPVYVTDEGKDIAFDAPGTVATITRLNAEAKGHREAKEMAETKLAPFAGIEDPAAAIKALETVKNLDSKKLVDAGEVQKVRDEAIKAVRAEYSPIVKKAEKLEQELYGEKIGGAFARSKFIADKVAVPADLLQASFGNRFKIEDGKVVAYGADGNKVYSKSNPGNPADFEEALEILVDQYPHKASILKGSGASGSGAGGSNPGAGGKKTYTRAQFDQLDPAGQRAASAEVSKGAAVLTD